MLRRHIDVQLPVFALSVRRRPPFVQRCFRFEGKSVADVLADADVQAREHGTFNEPPGVLRGISVVTNAVSYTHLTLPTILLV